MTSGSFLQHCNCSLLTTVHPGWLFYVLLKENSFISIKKRAFLVSQNAEAHAAVLLIDPHLLTPWIPSKQWPSSHYAPSAQPRVGPFPRRFTNPTAYPSNTLPIVGLVHKNVNNNELLIYIFSFEWEGVSTHLNMPSHWSMFQDFQLEQNKIVHQFVNTQKTRKLQVQF